jgi:hypothetical protein
MKKPTADASSIDIAEIMTVAEKIAEHTNNFQADTIERIEHIENHIIAVESEVILLKKRAQAV